MVTSRCLSPFGSSMVSSSPVAASPFSLVSASTLKLSIPTCWTIWSTIPLLILVWPGGGAWRGMVMTCVLVDEQPGTKVMCLRVRSVLSHPGTLFHVWRSAQRSRTSVCDGVQQSELFPPKPPCGLGIHGYSRQVTQQTATELCVATDDVLSFPGRPLLSDRALRRFLSSVLSVSFSFC